MKKLTLTLAALTTIALVSFSIRPVQAAGFGWYVSPSPVYQTGYFGYSPSPTYVTSRYDASPYVWHNTSHLHYRPPTLRWHGNHFDYEPARYEVHDTGHWDHVH